MARQPELRQQQPSESLHSLARGLAVLRVLLESPHGMTLNQLAVAVGVHKASVLRTVRTLVREGYVSAEPPGPRYFPGPIVVKFALTDASSVSITNRARPLLSKLSAAHNETIALFVPVWPDLVCTVAIPSSHPVRRHREVGEIHAMTQASVGRAFLAFTSRAYADATLVARPLKRLTPNTLTDIHTFHAELRDINRKGYAVSVGEANLDMAGIAAPVWNEALSAPLGVISISAPLFRESAEQIETFAPELSCTASELASSLAATVSTRSTPINEEKAE